jgi:nucleoside-diphosphate-sugar epimerase
LGDYYIYKPKSNKLKNKVEIVGNGMIAKSLQDYQVETISALVFASGVADSTCQDQKQYDREHDLLKDKIQYCLKTEKVLVYFSSAGAVYGNCNEPKDEKSSLNPAGTYGFNKVISEKLITESGVKYLVLRVSNLVGRNQNIKQLIPYLVNNAINGKVQVYSDATRDLLDVEDLAKWTNLLLQKVNKNETVNMASGISVSISDIMNEIIMILQINAGIETVKSGDKHSFSVTKLQGYINSRPDHNYWKNILIKYVTEKTI